MPAPSSVILDDRLLVEEVLIGLRRPRREIKLFTTVYWYYRASRAAVAGGSGKLSGPFMNVDTMLQRQAIRSLLQLPDAIDFVHPKQLVPAMADIARAEPHLNLMNLEAIAAAQVLNATVWLSAATTNGILPDALTRRNLRWKTVSLN